MNKAKSIFLWMCALLALLAGAQAGSITGRVTGPWGFYSMEGIFVQSYNQTAKVLGPSAITDTNGIYVIGNLTAATYRVSFRDTNEVYAGEVYDNAGYNPYDFSVGKDIVVPAVGTVSNINTALYVYPTITGRVTRLDGLTPISNVEVGFYFLYEDGEYTRILDQVTDANGNYTSMHLWPGQIYFVKFRDLSGVYMSEVYNDFPGTNYAQFGSAILQVPNHSTNVSASLSLPSQIAGTVMGPGGAPPIPGVRVTAYLERGTNWIGVASNLTDEDGAYELGPLPARAYRVWFDDRSENYCDEVFDNAPDLASGTNVVVPEGTVVNVDAWLSDASFSEFSGQVTASFGQFPLAGIVVESSNVAADVAGPWVTTGLNGTYTNRVATGTYRVRFRDTNGVFIGEVYNNVVGSNLSLGANVIVPSNQAISSIDAALDLFSTISGTVRGPDGTTPLTGIVVETSNVTAGVAGPSVITAANGTYVIGGLMPETFRIRFRDTNGVYLTEVYNDVFGDDFSLGADLPLSVNKDLFGLQASLEKRQVLTGLVRQEGGGHFDFQFIGTMDQGYVLQEAATLTGGWTDVDSVIADFGTSLLSRTTSATQAFWRIQRMSP